MTSPSFAERLIRWQRSHGRHHLPWQVREPYCVWLSEIMLQQTQVATVLDYYPRFVARFPDVAALAAAPQDDVLGLWAGLGYYSRARNLHKAARQVVEQFGGQFPSSRLQLESLCGVGRSTAAAIAAFAFHQRESILDGNVKRVLCRVFAADGNPADKAFERQLWALAESLLPEQADDMPAYTQGLMDLGASICSQRRPACTVCPLVDVCVAARAGEPERYPVKTRRTARRQATLWLLHAQAGQGRVWLVQRPAKGIWARLFCLPLFESDEALMASLPASARADAVLWPAFRHVLTHRDLDIHIVSARLGAHDLADAAGRWFGADEWPALGLPAPIRKFLQQAA